MADVYKVELDELGAAEVALKDIMQAAGLTRERLADALEPLVTMEASWTPGKVALRAGLSVGTVQAGNLRVDVRPRLAAAEMATLIRYAFGGPVGGWQRSRIGDGRVGLDELVCGVFADELSALRQVGLSRNYVNRRESLPVLRGRPDFIASFPWNNRGMTTITCRFHELTCDNLDNQLLRAALERATLMDTTVPTRRRLLEHRQAWSAIASLRPVSGEDFTTARERYTRLSEHYRLSHNLAELILSGRRPASLFDAGKVPTGGLSLDMPGLFELFVERLLKEFLRPHGLAVRSQERDRGALLDGEGRRYRNVRPDIVVYAGDQPTCVVDAKYKSYWPAASDGTPVRRVSNEDLYQLFFYAQRLQLRYKLAKVPPAFIISPLPTEDERSVAAIGDRFRVIRWQAGGDACEVYLLLLPLTQILRQMPNHPLRDAIAGGLDSLIH